MYENTLNKASSAKSSINLTFRQSEDFCVSLGDFGFGSEEKLKEKTSLKICSNYSTHGYCKNTEKCDKSHDINLIIKSEVNQKSKKKKKSKQSEAKTSNEDSNETKMETEGNSEENLQTEKEVEKINQMHSAGLDAFMTGYAMLNYLNKYSKLKLKNAENSNQLLKLNDFEKLDEFNFKIYLTGKDYPLMVQKSNFATNSTTHKEKRLKLMNKPK